MASFPSYVVCSLLVLSVLFFASSHGQTAEYVPMVAPANTNYTFLDGTFLPNGTLTVGQTAYFYISISGWKEKNAGITISLDELKSFFTNSSTARLLLRHGGYPTTSQNANSYTTTCQGALCEWWLFRPNFGTCYPEDGTWYFSITNEGASPFYFELEVAVDSSGGSLFGCNKSFDNWLTTAVIIIISCVGGGILLIVCCVIACCCCAANSGGRSYHHVRSEPAVVVYTAPKMETPTYYNGQPPAQYGNAPPPQYNGNAPPPQYNGNAPPQYNGNAPPQYNVTPGQYGSVPTAPPQYGTNLYPSIQPGKANVQQV